MQSGSTVFFFFNDTATTENYTRKDTLSLHDALPISPPSSPPPSPPTTERPPARPTRSEEHTSELQSPFLISYAVFCLKKKKKKNINVTFAFFIIQLTYMNTITSI